MTTTWDSFMKRRNIDLGKFLTVNGIKTRVELLAHLSMIGVEPPDEKLIDSIFPPPPPVVLSVVQQDSTHEQTEKSTTVLDTQAKSKSKSKNN